MTDDALRELMCEVIAALPDHKTLRELIEAARDNPDVAPVLDIFTVQELIDAAKKRSKPAARATDDELLLDDDGNPVMDLGDVAPAVIRRRAGVQGGDLRVLRVLAQRGPRREIDLANNAAVTREQLRPLIRHLHGKGLVHVEGSGAERRLELTRRGSKYLRNA